MKVEIIENIEERQIIAKKTSSDEFTSSYPVLGSEKYFLKLKLPSGRVVVAKIDYNDFNAYLEDLKKQT